MPLFLCPCSSCLLVGVEINSKNNPQGWEHKSDKRGSFNHLRNKTVLTAHMYACTHAHMHMRVHVHTHTSCPFSPVAFKLPGAAAIHCAPSLWRDSKNSGIIFTCRPASSLMAAFLFVAGKGLLAPNSSQSLHCGGHLFSWEPWLFMTLRGSGRVSLWACCLTILGHFFFPDRCCVPSD